MAHGKHCDRHDVRMSRRERLAVYWVMGTLWISGCLWLYLQLFLSKQGEFGRTPHPMQPPLLLLHAIVAILSMYLFGYVSTRHMVRGWRGGHRRLSGGTFVSVLIVVSVSGFALFFLSDDHWQHVSELTHEAVGVAGVVFALQHWLLRTSRATRLRDGARAGR